MTSPRTGAWLVDGVIFSGWLMMVALVVVHEHGVWGGWLRMSRALPASLEVREQWFGLYYQGSKVGFTHVLLVPDEQDGMPGLAIEDQGRLRFTLLGTPQLLEIRSRAFIDAQWQLRTVRMTVEAEGYRLGIDGKREGDDMVLTLSTASSRLVQRLRDPAGRLWIGGLSSWSVFHELQVGQEGQLWVVNPLALKPESARFAVRRREELDGHDALVVETDYQGIRATTWITPTGVVLKETSPLGWELKQESPRQALEALGGPPLDLLSTVSVAVDRPLEDPARLGRLTVLVEGVGADVFRVDRRPWQEVLPASALASFGATPPRGAWCVVRLQHPTRTRSGAAPPGAPPSRYTAASPFIQSTDPRIHARAAAIAGSLATPWAQASAVHRWVYQTLTKRLTVGFPLATDVLDSLTGDCHEHTVLFTALARSLGIPTRMVAGLVYYEGRFYYHAWPEVWDAVADPSTGTVTGGWMPLDPTLGQALADATHIGFVEAEDEHLLALAQVVGQFRVRILEMK